MSGSFRRHALATATSRPPCPRNSAGPRVLIYFEARRAARPRPDYIAVAATLLAAVVASAALDPCEQGRDGLAQAPERDRDRHRRPDRRRAQRGHDASDDQAPRRRRHHVHPEHRLEPPLLPVARRLSHRPVPPQLRRDRQRARLRRAHRQGLHPPRLAAGRRLPHRLRRPLPPQLRPRTHGLPGPFEDTAAGYAAPAGVEDWFGYVGSQTIYSGASFSDNGLAVTAGTGPAGYSTKVINRAALDFVRDRQVRPPALLPPGRPPRSPLEQLHRPGRGALRQGRAPGPRGRRRLPPVPQPPAPQARLLRRAADRRQARLGRHPPGPRPRPPAQPQARLPLRARHPRDGRPRRRRADRAARAPGRARRHRRSSSPPTTATSSASTASSSTRSSRTRRRSASPSSPASRRSLLGAKARRDGTAGRGHGPGQQPRPHRHHPRPRGRRPVHRVAATAAPSTAAPCARCSTASAPTGRAAAPCSTSSAATGPAARSRPSAASTTSTTPCAPKRYVYVELDRVNKETGICDRPEYELYDLKTDPYQLRNLAVNPAVATPSPLQARSPPASRSCAPARESAAATRRPTGRTASSYASSRSRCASGSCLSFFSVLFSIWRIRSRVTPNARPTSSSVSGSWPRSP